MFGWMTDETDPTKDKLIESHVVLNELMQTYGRLKSSDVQLLLNDQYEQLYGLRNHEAEGHPFGPILMNEMEDVYTDGAVHERMKQYDKFGIKDIFGMSYNDFVAHPTFRVMQMLEYAQSAQTEKSRKTKKALDDLGIDNDSDS